MPEDFDHYQKCGYRKTMAIVKIPNNLFQQNLKIIEPKTKTGWKNKIMEQNYLNLEKAIHRYKSIKIN